VGDELDDNAIVEQIYGTVSGIDVIGPDIDVGEEHPM
jgi:hypothetical protein